MGRGVGVAAQKKGLAASFHGARRVGRLLHLHQRRLHWRLRPLSLHAHEQRQRPAGDVIRRQDVLAGGGTDLREALYLQHFLDEGAVRLVHAHHQCSLGIGARAHLECCGGAVHLHAVLQQDVDHSRRSHRVSLLRRDQVGVRRRAASFLHGVLGHARHVAQQVLAVARGGLQQRAGADDLVVHDVAQMPPAAGPGVGEVHLLAVVRQPLAATAQLVLLDAEGRGHVHAGGLGEQTHDVLPPRRVHGAAGPVAVVGEAIDDAGATVLLQAHRHLGTEEIGETPDERVDVDADGVLERRHEHARPGAAHLVDVQVHLREPVMVEHSVHRPGLRQVEHEPVAVVVVAGVVVVEPRHAAALVLGSEVLAVPVHHHLLAVGVDGRSQQQDHVVQDAGPWLLVGDGHVPGQLHGHLAGGDLRGVDVASDQDDGLALRHQLLDLPGGEPARVGQLASDVAVAGGVGEVVGGGDHRHPEVTPLHAVADVQELQPVGRVVEDTEVGADLVVVRQATIRPHHEAEEFLRHGDGSSDGRGAQAGEQDDTCQEERDSTHGQLRGRFTSGNGNERAGKG